MGRPVRERYWSTVIADFRRSGLTQAEFCRRRHVIATARSVDVGCTSAITGIVTRIPSKVRWNGLQAEPLPRSPLSWAHQDEEPRTRSRDRPTELGDWLGRLLLDRASTVFAPHVDPPHPIRTAGQLPQRGKIIQFPTKAELPSIIHGQLSTQTTAFFQYFPTAHPLTWGVGRCSQTGNEGGSLEQIIGFRSLALDGLLAMVGP